MTTRSGSAALINQSRSWGSAMARTATTNSRQSLAKHAWTLLRQSISGFLSDECLTRGAAIAFYTVTSIGPVLFIVIQIAALVFGEKQLPGP